MNRSLLDRIRMVRPAPDRTTWGRRAPIDGDAVFPTSAGHGSRMPSQRATTRVQRPY